MLDRLLRGRAWVACVGLLLAGIVFLNVSLLEVNGGIANVNERATALKRQNAALRLEVARLVSSERIERAAVAQGFVMPAPGDVAYVEADAEADPDRAVRALKRRAITPTAFVAPGSEAALAADAETQLDAQAGSPGTLALGTPKLEDEAVPASPVPQGAEAPPTEAPTAPVTEAAAEGPSQAVTPASGQGG